MNIKELEKKNRKTTKRFDNWAKIDRSNLDSEMSKNGSRLFSVGKKIAKAEFIRDSAKSKLKQTEARARKRLSTKKVKGKSLTIPQVNARIDIAPEVIEAESLLNEANYVVNLCKSAASSMKEKGQHLTNLSNNKRAELNSNVRSRVSKKFKQ